jgi:hypothetical protein
LNIITTNTTSAIAGNLMLPNYLTFPLSDVYYITPSYVTNSSIPIILPPIATTWGIKVMFRVVSRNTVSNSYVTLFTLGAGNLSGFPTTLFNGTSATPGGNQQLYNTNSAIILSTTYFLLPTTMAYGSGTKYAWFQQGLV